MRNSNLPKDQTTDWAKLFKDTDKGQIIVELLKLSPIDYNQKRKEAAKALKCSVVALDKEMDQMRKDQQEHPEDEQIITDDGVYVGEADGAELLNEIRQHFKNHLVADPAEHTAAALWVMGTYCFEAFTLYPILNVISPMKRCGKSIALDLVDCLSFRSLIASNVTASAIFRIIEEYHPTLVIDEADTFMDENEGMRGIINSTHRKRTAFVLRSEKIGETFRPKRFNTWTPLAIAGINKRAATITDRSITMRLKRKLSSDKVKRLHGDSFKDDAKLLRQKCAKWGKDNLYNIKTHKPKMPDCHNDRLMDNWEPLFAIANAAGDHWPDRVMSSYITHANADGKEIGSTLASRLLMDIYSEIDSGLDKISSAVLVQKLLSIEDGPWRTANRGYNLDQNLLAFLLEPFGIKPTQMKFNGVNNRGYHCKDLIAECDRYLKFEELEDLRQSETYTLSL